MTTGLLQQRCVQIIKPGGYEVLKYSESLFQVPAQLAVDELLVENAFIGVNFIDTYHRSGLYVLPSYPVIPGREASGTIIKTAGTDDAEDMEWKVGDCVAYLAMGTYARYSIVKKKWAVKVPPTISMETAAATLLQGLTALILLKEASQIRPHLDSILIHAAAGGVGQWLVQLAAARAGTKAYPAKLVIGTTSSAEKAKFVIENGADHVVLYKTENITEKVMHWTEGKGVDIVYDGIGKDTLDVSLACLAKHGKLISFGNASGKVTLGLYLESRPLYTYVIDRKF